MKLKEIVDRFHLEAVCSPTGLENEVRGGYASDLLSDVLAHGQEGDLWCTLQTHQNIIAVASLKGVAGVILVTGRTPAEDTVEKAKAEDIPLLMTALPAFEIIGKLYELGVRGTRTKDPC